jgi:hypothetical protein
MGQGSGGSGSGSRSTNFDINYSFDIYSLQADGQTPTTFERAVENFKGVINHNELKAFDFESPGFEEEIDTRNNPLKLDLQAKELKAGDQITLLSGDPAINWFSREELTTSKDRIEFTLSSKELEDLGVDEFTLVIEDDDTKTPGLQAGGETIDTSLATANGSSENEAIEYIIDNELFSSTDFIRLSAGSIDQSGKIVSEEFGRTEDEFADFTPNEGRPDQPDTDPVLDGDDVITGDNGDNTLDGGEGNNVLRGLDGNDVLTTGAGSDNLDGGNGDDDLSSGAGNDILTGGAGSDLFDCGDGNDTVDGGDGNDDIFGAGGDDLINGGNGDDLLNGGAGQDVLVGDGGADIFEIGTAGGTDIIRDFNYGQDLIGLSDGITFEDLIVTQGDGAAILSYQDQAIASISGGTPGQINESLFSEI